MTTLEDLKKLGLVTIIPEQPGILFYTAKFEEEFSFDWADYFRTIAENAIFHPRPKDNGMQDWDLEVVCHDWQGNSTGALLQYGDEFAWTLTSDGRLEKILKFEH